MSSIWGRADNGNVFKITNGKDANRNQNFTYDALNRIKTAATQGTTGATCWGQMFGHMNGSTFVPGIDPWGNLDLPPDSVHGIIRQVGSAFGFNPSPAAVAGAVGKWETPEAISKAA